MNPDDGELAELARTVRELLAKHTHEALSLADRMAAPDAIWPRLAGELGLAGLLVPAELGGLDLGLAAAAAVSEELGRACYGGPFVSSCVAATALLREVDDPAARELLAGMADGGRITAVAVSDLTVTADGTGATLAGRSGPVLDLERADALVVAAEDDAGPVIALLADPVDHAVSVEALPSLDLGRRPARIELAGAAATVLATGPAARRALDAALVARGVVVAADAVGVAAEALDLVVDYARKRVQFGRTIGSFQGVKHALADLHVQLQVARSAVAYALLEGGPRGMHAAMAKAPEIAVTVATEALQLHGGIGYTWEYPAHVLLRRARADAALFGTPADHRRALFQLIDEGDPA